MLPGRVQAGRKVPGAQLVDAPEPAGGRESLAGPAGQEGDEVRAAGEGRDRVKGRLLGEGGQRRQEVVEPVAAPRLGPRG